MRIGIELPTEEWHEMKSRLDNMQVESIGFVLENVIYDEASAEDKKRIDALSFDDPDYTQKGAKLIEEITGIKYM